MKGLVTHQPLVSIIVRTYNEERWIGFCLDAISRQNYTNYEIILVDNMSTDHTVAKAQSYCSTILEIDEFLPGKAINEGIRAANGEIFVIISGHCIPVDEDWLGNLISGLDDPEVAGIYGRQEPMSFTSPLDKRDLAITFGLDRRIQVKDSFFHNANSALRRDIWKRFPFDENVTNIEDRVWAVEVINAGLKLVYEPSASVYHHHGIHQQGDLERAQKVVRIMEDLHGPHSDMSMIVGGVARVVAIVPIRGKSLQCGETNLLTNTIAYLKSCNTLADIVVSTDNTETAELARQCGATVPFIRPPSLSEKYVDISQVLSYSLNELEKLGRIFDLVVFVEETYQFRDPSMIDEMVLLALNNGLDTIIAAKEENRPIWMDEGSIIRQIGAHNLAPRDLRQERTHLGLMGLGCVTRPMFLRKGALLGGKIGLHTVHHPLAGVEIRSEEDLSRCESLLRNYQVNCSE